MFSKETQMDIDVRAAHKNCDAVECEDAQVSRPGNAVLYRAATPDHLCPLGLKSKSLLERKGYSVEDNKFTTKAEIQTFKEANDFVSTPQIYICGEHIGGYSDLRRFFGKTVLEQGGTTYLPVIAIFGGAALMAMALVANFYSSLSSLAGLKWFFAFSMVMLAVQKLQDVEAFVNGFLSYDLLARRYVPYGYVYPYLELFAGITMMTLIGNASALVWLVAPITLFIGTIGSVSVVKAVYIEKRELTCACVGGGSKVPLGFVSLVENVVMIAMGLWMLRPRMFAVSS
jgi:glutaredoxin